MYPKYIFCTLMCYYNLNKSIDTICFDQEVFISINFIESLNRLNYLCNKNSNCTYHTKKGFHYPGIIIFKKIENTYEIIELCSKNFLSIIFPPLDVGRKKLYVNINSEKNLCIDNQNIFNFYTKKLKYPELYLNVYVTQKEDNTFVYLSLEKRKKKTSNKTGFLGGTVNSIKFEMWNKLL